MSRPLLCLALAGLAAPLSAQRGAYDPAEQERRIRILQQNVDHAFLWNYLYKNKGKVRPAPGRMSTISTALLRATGQAMRYRCHLYLVESPLTNAATSPGGNIFVYRGILDLGLTQAEIAAMLSHEVAHMVHYHWLARLQRGLTAAVLARYTASVYGKSSAQAAYLYQTIQNLQYNRAEEEQADATGLKLLAGAGYPPQALADLLEKIQRHQARLPAEGDPPTYLATHPLLPERIARARALAASTAARPPEKRLRRLQLAR